jgi:hypothetical protein
VAVVQYSTAQHSTAQHSPVQYSTAQHSTAQYSTVQHSTAQHSAAQHSTLTIHDSFVVIKKLPVGEIYLFIYLSVIYFKDIRKKLRKVRCLGRW